MASMKAGEFGRNLRIDQSSVRMLCEWRLLSHTRNGSALLIDEPVPDRTALIDLVRRAAAAQARIVVNATNVIDREVEAIRFDAQEIVDAVAAGATFSIDGDLATFAWSTHAPIRQTYDQMAEAQMLLQLMQRVLRDLDPPGVPLA